MAYLGPPDRGIFKVPDERSVVFEFRHRYVQREVNLISYFLPLRFWSIPVLLRPASDSDYWLVRVLIFILANLAIELLLSIICA